MNEDPKADEQACRSCWQNCGVAPDAEMLKIDAMEDAISPASSCRKTGAGADGQVRRIRELITCFEACYHEADKEAERIVKAIGQQRCPRQSHARPPRRKRELENSRRILCQWCRDPAARPPKLHVGGVRSDELVGFIGQATPLKVWQVQRVVNRVGAALDSSRPYHNLILNVGDYGEPAAAQAPEYYKDDAAFLEQTRKAIIHDQVEGRQATISLAMAIDLLMPCHWDFIGGLTIILRAIGEDLHPQQPYTCCSRNLHLSPLCGRLGAISSSLRTFWTDQKPAQNMDCKVLSSLGAPTPAKRWLAASLDKTIRLQLQSTSDFWLKFA